MPPADELPTHGLYLNGRLAPTRGEAVEVTNPATGKVIVRVTTVGREEVRQAFADAQGAFAAWRELPAKVRGDHLHAVADELEHRADEIARTITLENGKPLAQSRGEVAVSVDHLRWFAEEAKRAYGRWIPHQVPGKRHLVMKSPVGVVGAISPWNFPLVLAVRKVAPALAAGCPVVLKPAPQTPLCAVALAECFDAANVPAGVFQLVLGDAEMIGREMLENPVCRKITFTGSTRVGKLLIAGAAEQVKRLSLELGGHAPVLVFDDADVDRAVEGVLIAKFRNNGQSCIAANRIYVQTGVYDRFADAFVTRVKTLKVGDPLADGVDVGAMVNEAGLQSALDQIEDAKSCGATVLCGGRRHGDFGSFLEPTVIADVPDDAVCMSQETFAPVAPLLRFDAEEEGIRRANDSPFGLSAYVFTENIERALRVAERIDAGTIGLNDGAPSTSIAPFGGLKQSGWGRELGSEGLDAFLETKHVSIGINEGNPRR